MYPGACYLFGKGDSLNTNLHLLNPLLHIRLTYSPLSEQQLIGRKSSHFKL